MVEAAGIPTVLVSTGRDLTELVCPPRSLFVNFPMGNPFGGPEDPETQRSILTAALALASSEVPYGTVVDWHGEWDSDFTDKVAANLLAM